MHESKRVRYSAPGKLFFLGEYGVLAGGWTLVAAINRRIQADRRPDASGYRAIGAGSEEIRKLPDAVLAILGEEDGSGAIDFFETDVRSFFEGSQKLGLGSSAASAVALSAAALNRKYPDLALDRVFQTAFHAHRLLQNGRGSGGDVAASTYGGLLAYRLDTSTPPFTAQHDQARYEGERSLAGTRMLSGLKWPDELEFRAVWTGQSASSTALIGRIEETLANRPSEVSEVLLEISKVSEAGIHALRTGDPSGFVQSVSKADKLMGMLGDLSGASIITERHRRLRNLADRYGIVAKASGAGGGDFSLLVGTRDAPWNNIERALPTGCAMIELQIDTRGVSQD